jgi:alkylhydroperoxidase family enzyme
VSWLPEHAPGLLDSSDDFERVFSLRPNLYEAWREFAAVFWEKRLVDPVILELCRLRVAQLHRARYPLSTRMSEARDGGLDEARIGALERWWESDAFAPLERACLRFAEQFVVDAKSMEDPVAAPVVEALGDAGSVAFVEALAIFDGFSRFCCMLDVAPREAAA